MINCLHNLSRRIATVLQHEERRCQYLTREAKLILALQDEVSAVADGECCRLRIMGLGWLMASLGVVSPEDQLVTMLCFEAIADNATNCPLVSGTLLKRSSVQERQAYCLVAGLITCQFSLWTESTKNLSASTGLSHTTTEQSEATKALAFGELDTGEEVLITTGKQRLAREVTGSSC